MYELNTHGISAMLYVLVEQQRLIRNTLLHDNYHLFTFDTVVCNVYFNALIIDVFLSLISKFLNSKPYFVGKYILFQDNLYITQTNVVTQR